MSQPRFRRSPPKRSRPNRHAGTLYRAASDDARAIGGLPIDSIEAGVTAAVRMAYKVAEAQIDRTARLGKRLREAGDSAAGEHSDQKALDATEQLIFRSIMAGLGWLEGVASDRANPLKRLALAEYKILGALFGLSEPDTPSATTGQESTLNVIKDALLTTKARPVEGRPLVKHKGAKRRAVLVQRWQVATSFAAENAPLTFFRVDGKGGAIDGRLTADGRGGAIVELELSSKVVPGEWRGAICDDNGVQVGYIEILL